MKKKLVVVTRSKPGSEAWMKHLRKSGFAAYHFPTIETGAVNRSPALVVALRDISRFDWIVFTSTAGPRFLKEFLKIGKSAKLSKSAKPQAMSAMSASAKNLPKKIVLPKTALPKIAVIGERTADAVRKAGYQVAFRASRASGNVLARGLARKIGIRKIGMMRAQSILFLRTAIASAEPVAILKKLGAKVTDIPIYQTKLIDRPDQKFSALLATDGIACLTFASPSAVEGFCTRVPKKLLNRAKELPTVAIGPTVRATLKKAGFKNIRTAKEPSIEGMVMALHAREL